MELAHFGANSYICAARGAQIYGAVDGPNALGQFVPAMPEEVIEETIEAFANAAAFAKFCGFGNDHRACRTRVAPQPVP